MFETYPEIPEVMPEDEVSGAVSMDRKILKQLKKNAKLMKKILKNQREINADRPKKSAFWSKVGDFFCKTIPRVLEHIATQVVKGWFSRKKERAEA